MLQRKPKQRADRIEIPPWRMEVRHRPMRVLDFDIENRPLSYLGSDFTTGEVTAIAWAWVGEPGVTVRLLGRSSLEDILDEFVDVYNVADMVTGHFIRGHDLPMVNGALVELGRPVLRDKMTCDTKLDFVRTKGISLSQESIAWMLKIEAAKVHMHQGRWRAANRLTEDGLAFVEERCVGDVHQHIAMCRECRRKDYLAAPKMWRSGNAALEAYTP